MPAKCVSALLCHFNTLLQAADDDDDDENCYIIESVNEHCGVEGGHSRGASSCDSRAYD